MYTISLYIIIMLQVTILLRMIERFIKDIQIPKRKWSFDIDEAKLMTGLVAGISFIFITVLMIGDNIQPGTENYQYIITAGVLTILLWVGLVIKFIFDAIKYWG